MANKWIVNDGKIYMSANIELHSDLHGKNRLDEKKTIGGGHFHFDKAKNIFYFFGKSIDYGQVSKERFDAAFKNSVGKTFRTRDAEVFFSSKEYLPEAIKEYELRQQQQLIEMNIVNEKLYDASFTVTKNNDEI